MRIRFYPSLRVAGGKIVRRGGMEVYAAAMVKKRELFLDSSLLDHAPELIRIFAHEVFHFVWGRIGNETRRSWEALIRAERRRRMTGELGWSAQLYKNKLAIDSGRVWRDYLCESFCDTAGWYFSGVQTHDEFTLPVTARRKRARWFAELLEKRKLPI
jgi:hypothetical protein